MLAVTRVTLWAAAGVVVLGILLSSLASVEVTVDRNGLDIRYGWLPLPRTHIPLRHIAEAASIDVRPMEWGGWGYRGSLKVLKKAAVVVRAGEGIRLVLRDGAEFAVTLEDSARGAGLLNDLLARSGAGTDAGQE